MQLATVKKALGITFKVAMFLLKKTLLTVCFVLGSLPNEKEEEPGICDVMGGERVYGSNDYIPKSRH